METLCSTRYFPFLQLCLSNIFFMNDSWAQFLMIFFIEGFFLRLPREEKSCFLVSFANSCHRRFCASMLCRMIVKLCSAFFRDRHSISNNPNRKKMPHSRIFARRALRRELKKSTILVVHILWNQFPLMCWTWATIFPRIPDHRCFFLSAKLFDIYCRIVAVKCSPSAEIAAL